MGTAYLEESSLGSLFTLTQRLTRFIMLFYSEKQFKMANTIQKV